jgi:hypothetical protein
MTNEIIDERGRKILIQRHNHALKLNAKCEIPKNLLFIDTESNIIRDKNKIIHTFKLVCCKYYQLRNGEYRNEQNKHFWSLTEFHAYLDSLQYNNTKLYVVAHNFNYDFNVLGLFDYRFKPS